MGIARNAGGVRTILLSYLGTGHEFLCPQNNKSKITLHSLYFISSVDCMKFSGMNSSLYRSYQQTTALLVITLLNLYLFTISVALTCKPEDYGALGDGEHFDTVEISLAVSACQNGGTIQFEPGKTYLTGEITITGKGVILDVPPTTTLLSSAEVGAGGPESDMGR